MMWHCRWLCIGGLQTNHWTHTQFWCEIWMLWSWVRLPYTGSDWSCSSLNPVVLLEIFFAFFMTGFLVLIDHLPWYKSVLAWSFTKARQSIHCSHLNSWLLYIQWNFINLAPMETDRCQIIKYSRLPNTTCTDHSSLANF